MDLRLARLRHLRNALANEISMASERGAHEVMEAVVRARNAMNDALAAAGDQEAVQYQRDMWANPPSTRASL
jgi:seryl-tRNA synthetase